MGLRAHTFSNYSMLSVPEAHAVLCDMVNRDIALWVSELMRAAQRSSPAVVLPPAGTVFDPPPMPEFVRTLEFCRGGGEVLQLVLRSIGSGADRPTKRKATAPPAGSPGSKGKANSSLPQACRMFARTGKCDWSRVSSCTRPPRPRHPRHLHPLAGMKAVEAWRRRTESRGRCRCVRSSPREATGGATGVEGLVLVLDEDTGPAARRGQPLRAQLRRRRWMARCSGIRRFRE